jgi:hypothetical protein
MNYFVDGKLTKECGLCRLGDCIGKACKYMILVPSWNDKNSTHEYTCHRRSQGCTSKVVSNY